MTPTAVFGSSKVILCRLLFPPKIVTVGAIFEHGHSGKCIVKLMVTSVLALHKKMR